MTIPRIFFTAVSLQIKKKEEKKEILYTISLLIVSVRLAALLKSSDTSTKSAIVQHLQGIVVMVYQVC